MTGRRAFCREPCRPAGVKVILQAGYGGEEAVEAVGTQSATGFRPKRSWPGNRWRQWMAGIERAVDTLAVEWRERL